MYVVQTRCAEEDEGRIWVVTVSKAYLLLEFGRVKKQGCLSAQTTAGSHCTTPCCCQWKPVVVSGHIKTGLHLQSMRPSCAALTDSSGKALSELSSPNMSFKGMAACTRARLVALMAHASSLPSLVMTCMITSAQSAVLCRAALLGCTQGHTEGSGTTHLNCNSYEAAWHESSQDHPLNQPFDLHLCSLVISICSSTAHVTEMFVCKFYQARFRSLVYLPDQTVLTKSPARWPVLGCPNTLDPDKAQTLLLALVCDLASKRMSHQPAVPCPTAPEAAWETQVP